MGKQSGNTLPTLEELGITDTPKLPTLDELGLKKKASLGASASTLQTSSKPSQASPQSTGFDAVVNPFQNTQEKFIGEEKAKEIRTQTAKPLKLDLGKAMQPVDQRSQVEKDLTAKRAKKLESKGTDIMNSLGVGVNQAYAGIAKIPRYVFELFGVPQNLLADAVKNNAGEDILGGIRTTGKEYDQVLSWLGGDVPMANSPLTMLDKLGDYFQGNAEQIQQKQTKYDQGIYDSITSGNLGEAGAQLVNNIAQSIPSMLTMATTSGLGNAGKLGAISKTALNALPFASSKANEIRDNQNIPEAVKPIYSGLYGLAEVIYDQSFGTQALLDKIVKTAAEGGKEVAEREAKDFAMGYLTNAFAKIKEPLTDIAKNAIEEGATTFSQNLLDKVAIDPNKDLMEGVVDSIIVGGTMGTAFSALNTIINPTVKAKIDTKNQQIDALSNDLDNPNIPETAKEVIVDKISSIKQEIADEISKQQQDFAKLDERSKERSLELSSTLNDINTSLTDESLSEDAKTALNEQKKTIEKELGSIKPKEQVVFTYESLDEVPDSLVDEVVEENGKYTVRMPKEEADILQTRIKNGEITDMALMEGRTEPVSPNRIENIIEVSEPAPIPPIETPQQKVEVKKSSDVVVGDNVELVDGRKGSVISVEGNNISINFSDGTTLTANPKIVEIFKNEKTAQVEPTESAITNTVTKSLELYEQIQNTDGAAKKRRLAEERRALLESSPKLKLIDDNISDIYNQLRNKNIIETKGKCL